MPLWEPDRFWTLAVPDVGTLKLTLRKFVSWQILYGYFEAEVEPTADQWQSYADRFNGLADSKFVMELACYVEGMWLWPVPKGWSPTCFSITTHGTEAGFCNTRLDVLDNGQPLIDQVLDLVQRTVGSETGAAIAA